MLLVRRAKPPAQGMWAMPGGKIEWRETSDQAAKRELWEECNIDPALLQWLGAKTVTDAIGEQYHFLIAQHLAYVDDAHADAITRSLRAGDDAAAAAFFTPAQLTALQHQGKLSEQVFAVVQLMRTMLPLHVQMTKSSDCDAQL